MQIAYITQFAAYGEKTNVKMLLSTMKTVNVSTDGQASKMKCHQNTTAYLKKLKGTKKWLDGMFETISDTVIVSVKFEDGTRKTFPAHTADGKWRKLPEIRNHKVTHWMPMPGPKEE